DDANRFHPVGRKSHLRHVGLRGLDPALFERPKTGFVLPYDRWIRRGLRDAMDDTFRDERALRAAGLAPAPVARLWRAFLDHARGMYWSRVWALYVLVRWCQRHRVSICAAAPPSARILAPSAGRTASATARYHLL